MSEKTPIEKLRRDGWRNQATGLAGISAWILRTKQRKASDLPDGDDDEGPRAKKQSRCTLTVHDNSGWYYSVLVCDDDGFSYPLCRSDAGLESGGPYANAVACAFAGFAHAERVLADPKQLAADRAAHEADRAAEVMKRRERHLSNAIMRARDAGYPDLVAALEQGRIMPMACYGEIGRRRQQARREALAAEVQP